MAIASVIVWPSSPVVAERIDVVVTDGPANAVYELHLDRVRIASLTADADGNLTDSISAAGHEVALANFGTARREHDYEWNAITLLMIKDNMHRLDLRML